MEKPKYDIRKLSIVLIKLFRERETEFPEDEISMRWLEVKKRVAMRRRWVTVIYTVSAAAVAALLCMLFIPGITYVDSGPAAGDIVSFALSAPEYDSDKLVCIVPGCDMMEMESKHVNVSIGTDGVIAVNDTVIHAAPAGGDNDFCRLIVPGGKRAELMLPDGSRIWANSRTSITYPREFASDHREIYVTGEVYAEISHDEKRPFTVLTRDFNVKVLGTSFNIMAYEADSVAQVVLVSGSINLAGKETEPITLTPGDLAEITPAGTGDPVKVDVEPYISWIHNILICSDEPLDNVCRRLHRCYDMEFVIEPSVADITVTGKLYLKDDLDAVLRSISYSTSVRFDRRDGKIYVSAQNR